MHKKKVNNIRLGIFVLIGTAFLIAGLYMIGNNRNMFNHTFTAKATFFKVNGLMKGNNVRFSGIDVGTVKSVRIASDTSIEVTMIIESDARRFIRKNARATIGTDGLMGNKLVAIDNTDQSAESVEDGDAIATMRPLETDQMMRTLDKTNKDLSEITSELKQIAKKVNNSNALWSILGDTLIADNFKQSIAAIKTTTRNTTSFTKGLDGLVKDMQRGKGMINYLIYDSVAPVNLRKSLAQVDIASDKASNAATELEQITERIKRGEGPAGMLVSDTVFARHLNESMRNIREGSAKLNENMEALKHNFLLRGYFRKQDKKARETGAHQEMTATE